MADSDETKARDIHYEFDIDALKMTMKSRNGRRLVRMIFDQVGLMRQPFTGERNTTDFNCGQKNTGYWLYDLIDQHCPLEYLTMLKEAKEDYNNDRRNHEYHNDADSIAVINGGNTGKHDGR